MTEHSNFDTSQRPVGASSRPEWMGRLMRGSRDYAEHSPKRGEQPRTFAVLFRALFFAFFAVWSGEVRGATLFWDFDTGTVGVQQGDGTWTTSATNWWTGSANSAFLAADVASFGGTGSGNVITIGGPVTAAGLIFNAGYSLTSASAQTLTLGATGIVVNGVSNLLCFDMLCKI